MSGKNKGGREIRKPKQAPKIKKDESSPLAVERHTDKPRRK